MAEFAELEMKAQAIYEFQVQALPGLTQTKNYMSALLDAAWPPLGVTEADRIRNGRLERQAVFKREPPPMCVFIVEEIAFRRDVGGSEVMKEQLDHLLRLAKDPFVQIQCVPTARGAHSAMDGSFVVLEMSEAESLVYAEVPGAGHVIVDAQTVANSQRKFGALRSQALPHEETVRFIEVRRGHLDD
ncbi:MULTISPECIES: DUF5753 domain-containing protein [Nocardiopsidaceae]|uniref:DUF5753 domain-containing protein n=1 Tax=Streptomonospora nanhaiensis TaxID=1323731 RepID=A0ABY6YFH5_9ACTN|nr:DUF5753 domain-containing protein [Streptomonospora nanhaiensis]WAE71003.1 DUF5753 domain-containing protein [Streptomonospora nanhaiensis]